MAALTPTGVARPFYAAEWPCSECALAQKETERRSWRNSTHNRVAFVQELGARFGLLPPSLDYMCIKVHGGREKKVKMSVMCRVIQFPGDRPANDAQLWPIECAEGK